MSMESNLKSLALGSPAVVALIGNRFFVDHIPEVSGGMVYPCIRAVTIDDPFLRTHAGTYGGRGLIQLDAFDNSAEQTRCDATAEALKSWLDNYRGALGNYRALIQIKNRGGGWETDSRLWRRMLEAEILYFV